MLDTTLTDTTATLALGVSQNLGLEAVMPFRTVTTDVHFEDEARQPFVPSQPDIHHRNETLAGGADPWLLVHAARPFTRWTWAARAGVTVPLGRTEPNPFVPERIELVGDVDQKPVLAVESAGLTVWLATDTSFGVPRATLFLRIALPGGLPTPRDVAAANLYARLVRDKLNAYAYPAEIAGLDYAVAPDNAGFLISITGYDDKQEVLLEEIRDLLKKR